MGKWSPNFTDDLLQTKISTLVTGALRRAAVDNDVIIGNMSYENFVHDLDTGDSFAATMVDIMVKELAERRVRHQADRRFLSPRTVKSLRQLATPLNQYPSRIRGNLAHRRPIAHEPYDDVVDDENFSLMLEDPTEGVHMSSADLHDAMSIPWPRRASEEPGSSSLRSTVPPLGVRSPTTNARPVSWSVLPSPTLPVTLTRQASIRRPFNNSRNIEFSNYTRRHRSSFRDGLDGEGVESVTEPREESRFSTSIAARRFFPPMTARRLRRNEVQRGAQRFAAESDGESSGDEDPLSMSLSNSAEQFISYIGHPPQTATSVSSAVAQAGGSIAATDTGDENVGGAGAGAPRLRRVHVRPPEGLVSQNAIPPFDGPFPGPEASSASQSVVVTRENLDEPAAYPTPGSSEGEHLT